MGNTKTKTKNDSSLSEFVKEDLANFFSESEDSVQVFEEWYALVPQEYFGNGVGERYNVSGDIDVQIVHNRVDCPGFVTMVSHNTGYRYVYGRGPLTISDDLLIFFRYLGVELIVSDEDYIIKTRNRTLIDDRYFGTTCIFDQRTKMRNMYIVSAMYSSEGYREDIIFTPGLMQDHRKVRQAIEKLRKYFPDISYEDYLLYREELLVEEALRETENFSLPAIGLNSVKDRTRYLREQ